MSDVVLGRPRDPRIDTEVLAATRDLLVEVGWDALSMRGIAARAGVGRAALHRRWPTKAHLVLDAILGSAPDLAPYTGIDRRGWIEWVVEGSFELFARPEVRAALPGLLVALREHDDLRKALWRTFSEPSTALFAGGSGTGPDALAVLVMAAGAAMFAGLVAGEDDTPALRAKILELLLPVAEAPSPTVEPPCGTG